ANEAEIASNAFTRRDRVRFDAGYRRNLRPHPSNSKRCGASNRQANGTVRDPCTPASLSSVLQDGSRSAGLAWDEQNLRPLPQDGFKYGTFDAAQTIQIQAQ